MSRVLNAVDKKQRDRSSAVAPVSTNVAFGETLEHSAVSSASRATIWYKNSSGFAGRNRVCGEAVLELAAIGEHR